MLLAGSAALLLPSVALAKPKQVKHDKKAARKAFDALFAAIMSGDPAALIPFEPIRFNIEKRDYPRAEYALFQKLATHNGDIKDKPLAKIGSFTRTKWDSKGKPVYLAALDRYKWFEEQDLTGIDGGIMPEGFSYGFEHWYVKFDGPHITHYVQNISMF
jgi:hypothetical protein